MNFKTKSGRNEQLTATFIEDEENSSSSLSNISRAPKIKRPCERKIDKRLFMDSRKLKDNKILTLLTMSPELIQL
uniref:Uncharacterized protein n=1 Tax=Rhizophagus irregularis (strain DAOM 181602 / DAOM 197198 / MUCL 43194) TaxID=747089 RepID=U9TZD1_RHIID